MMSEIMIKCDLDSSVPDWAIEYPQTMALFTQLQIDCSCGGKSLAYACRERGLEPDVVLEQLHRCLAYHNSARCRASLPREPSTQENRTMAIPHANPGDVIDVRPLGAALASTKTSTLLKTDKVEVVRLVMQAGKEIAEHKAHGEITVHCLEGKITFTALGKSQELSAGQLLFLNVGEPHSVKCSEDASVLLTILLRT